MKNECFSCQKNAPINTIQRLELHKRIYEQTGKVFYYFRESINGKTKIADNESFKSILPRIKKNKGSEWCHIAEFGQSTNDNVLGNTNDAKPKITK